MREFAVGQTAALLAGAAEACTLAARSPAAGPVHRMRVAIRRLQQALRLFSQYVPKRGVRRVRKELKRIMEPAGQLRDYDVAVTLAGRLGCPLPQLVERRSAAKQRLCASLAAVVRPDLLQCWNEALGIDADEKAVEG